MIRSYFLFSFRNLLRNKVFSTIHVLGLSIGLSAALVIFLIVKYEFSFDKFQNDPQSIYRVVLNSNFNGMAGKSASVPAALAPTIEEEVTGIRATIPVMQFQGDASIDVTINSLNFKQPAKFKKQTDIVFTTPSYFEMVPFEWQAGAGPQSLTKPFSVVLTASRARQYFNNLSFTEMIGMEILYGDKVTAVVTGIVKDLDEITDFTAREFISYSTIAKTSLQQDFMMDIWNDWMAYSKTYVILKSGVHSSTVARQINTLLKNIIQIGITMLASP